MVKLSLVEPTVKKESPGPNTMDGLMIVDCGSVSKKILSPAALVL